MLQREDAALLSEDEFIFRQALVIPLREHWQGRSIWDGSYYFDGVEATCGFVEGKVDNPEGSIAQLFVHHFEFFDGLEMSF